MFIFIVSMIQMIHAYIIGKKLFKNIWKKYIIPWVKESAKKYYFWSKWILSDFKWFLSGFQIIHENHDIMSSASYIDCNNTMF